MNAWITVGILGGLRDYVRALHLQGEQMMAIGVLAHVRLLFLRKENRKNSRLLVDNVMTNL